MNAHKKFARWRAKQKMSLRDVADKLNVSRPAVLDLETHAVPTATRAKMLEEITGGAVTVRDWRKALLAKALSTWEKS